MAVEVLEDQGLEKNPNLHLSQLKFQLNLDDFKNNSSLKEELLAEIQKESK